MAAKQRLPSILGVSAAPLTNARQGRVAAKQSWVSLPDPLVGRLSGKAERRRITEVLGQPKSPHAVRWRVDGLVTRKRLCLLGANTSIWGGGGLL